jgi:hypothetical protein
MSFCYRIVLLLSNIQNKEVAKYSYELYMYYVHSVILRNTESSFCGSEGCNATVAVPPVSWAIPSRSVHTFQCNHRQYIGYSRSYKLRKLLGEYYIEWGAHLWLISNQVFVKFCIINCYLKAACINEQVLPRPTIPYNGDQQSLPQIAVGFQFTTCI